MCRSSVKRRRVCCSVELHGVPRLAPLLTSPNSGRMKESIGRLMRQMRSAGESLRKIAEATGFCPSTVCSTLRQYSKNGRWIAPAAQKRRKAARRGGVVKLLAGMPSLIPPNNVDNVVIVRRGRKRRLEYPARIEQPHMFRLELGSSRSILCVAHRNASCRAAGGRYLKSTRTARRDRQRALGKSRPGPRRNAGRNVHLRS